MALFHGNPLDAATGPAPQMIITLPVPPSVNALYGNRKKGARGPGRYKTAAYRDWIRRADALLMTQKRSLVALKDGPLSLHIRLPKTTQGDASNRIKAVEDYLVSRELTPDDRHNWKVSIERCLNGENCEVEVLPL